MATKGVNPFAKFEKSKKDVEGKKSGGEKMPAALAKHASKPASEAHAGMKCGGGVKKMARGGGVEIKGKTKGRMI